MHYMVWILKFHLKDEWPEHVVLLDMSTVDRVGLIQLQGFPRSVFVLVSLGISAVLLKTFCCHLPFLPVVLHVGYSETY